ncbi:MAG: NUDIX domain-containing protein [Dehalococcoidia bacterium]|nr:NUDIX domain-containing protein [Dehalococcoidia bacterium]
MELVFFVADVNGEVDNSRSGYLEEMQVVEPKNYPDPGRPAYCGRCATQMEIVERGGRHRPVCPQCGWTYFARPAFGAAVIIEDEGRILLVRRDHEPYAGWWMLPAGFVEYDEWAAETAVREALEETGLEVRLAKLHGLYYGTDDPRNPSHLAVYRAEVVGGQLGAGDDAAALAFFSPDEVPRNIAFHGQRLAIAAWISAKLGTPVDPASYGEDG